MRVIRAVLLVAVGTARKEIFQAAFRRLNLARITLPGSSSRKCTR